MSNYYYWTVTPSGKWLMACGPDWERRKYGFEVDGLGDLIYRMGYYALVTGEPEVIKACIKLLNERKRWPSLLHPKNSANNKLSWWVSRLLYSLKITKTVKYRLQKDPTRDPYITISCAVFWHQFEMIQDLKIPGRINRPALRNWKKYLETRDSKYKDRYELWAKLSIDISSVFGFPAFVKSLNAWMAFVAQSDEIKAHLLPLIPHWNYVNRLLCGDKSINESDVNSYASAAGWIWNAEKPEDNPRWLGEGEPIYLDRDILKFVFENRNF